VSQPVDNPSRRFLLDTAQSAKQASALVREAWSKYHSPVDYGVVGLDLPKVAALIDAGMPARLYYTAYRNNAFDTHVFQNDVAQAAAHLRFRRRRRLPARTWSGSGAPTTWS
jgi:hypothetical protein